MRRLASAAPRSTNHEMRRPIANPIDACEERDPPSANRARAEAPDRETGRNEQAADDERGNADLATARDLDERLRVKPRGLQELAVARAGLRLHLAHPVEVAQLTATFLP